MSALYHPQYYLVPFHICKYYQATSEGVSHVKVIVKIKNLNFYQIFQICNFDFVLLWHGIWYGSIIWVIMGRAGYSQNAGVLVVLVHLNMGCLWTKSRGAWSLKELHLLEHTIGRQPNDPSNGRQGNRPLWFIWWAKCWKIVCGLFLHNLSKFCIHVTMVVITGFI